MNDADPRAQIAQWIERAVIGLGLCPFAAAPWSAGSVLLVVSEVRDLPSAIAVTLEEVRRMLETDEHTLATTLVAFPNALEEFEEFLDAAGAVDETLDASGARGIVQLATFHPQYRFAEQPEEALSNYTNRAPYPILHLLRESQVAAAVDAHPDPEGIPRSNIARLEALGSAGVLALWRSFAHGE